jgi:hypothetical protein
MIAGSVGAGLSLLLLAVAAPAMAQSNFSDSAFLTLILNLRSIKSS